MPERNKTEVSNCELKRDGKASRWRDLGNTAVQKGLCGGELLKKERGNDRHTPQYRRWGTLGGNRGEQVVLGYDCCTSDPLGLD